MRLPTGLRGLLVAMDFRVDHDRVVVLCGRLNLLRGTEPDSVPRRNRIEYPVLALNDLARAVVLDLQQELIVILAPQRELT